MSQRFLVAISFAMLCVCLFVGWSSWSSQKANRETIQSLSQQLAEQTKDGFISGQSGEWVPCVLRLVDKHGHPASEGFSVELTAPPHLNASEKSDFRMDEIKAEEDGIIDFGPLRRRVYLAAITSPWNERTYVKVDTRVSDSFDKTLTCPDSPLSTAPVAIDVSWPDDLKDRGFSLCFHLAQDSPHRPKIDGNAWSNCSASHFQLVVTSDGKFVRRADEDLAAFFPFTLYGEHNGGVSFNPHDEKSPIVLDEQSELWLGKYRVISMFVLPRTETANTLDELPPKSVALAVYHTTSKSYRDNEQPTRSDILGMSPEFVVRSGETNVWNVSPPHQLVEILREQSES